MEEEIDFRKLLSLIWAKKWIIVLITIISCVLGGIYSFFIVEPEYTAYTSMLLVQNNSGDGATTVTSQDITINKSLLSTYQALATSKAVVREVINNLNLKMTEDQLKKAIKVEDITDTQMLKVSVTSPSKEIATEVANELTRVFSKMVAEKYKIDNISVIDEAELPQTASNINHKKTIAIFTIAGFVLALGVIVVLNILDNTIDGAKSIEDSLGVPVVAELPICDFENDRVK